MKKVTFTVRFFQGEGGLFFAGEGIPHGFQITSSNGAIQSFDASQTTGHRQTVVANGIAPIGGSVDVQVTDENGNILSPFTNNNYTDGPVMGAIFYNL